MRLIVSGLVNIETTLKVDRFPIEYCPVRYPFDGVASSVSGVGVNLVLALKKLGDEPVFLTIVGEDEEGSLVFPLLNHSGVSVEHVLRSMPQTARSVIMYDAEGRRMINVDLKDLQQRRYPDETFLAAAEGAKAALLCNINFNRELLSLARRRDLPVLTDVHVLSDPKDPYDEDFMASAEVLFLSDERLWAPPREVAKELMGLYRARVVVIGMGSRGPSSPSGARAPSSCQRSPRGLSSPRSAPATPSSRPSPISGSPARGLLRPSGRRRSSPHGRSASEARPRASSRRPSFELIIPDLPGHIDDHPQGRS